MLATVFSQPHPHQNLHIPTVRLKTLTGWGELPVLLSPYACLFFVGLSRLRLGVCLLSKKAGEPLRLDDANAVLCKNGFHIHQQVGISALSLITVHPFLPKEKKEFLDGDAVINQLPMGPHAAIRSGHPREQRFAAHIERKDGENVDESPTCRSGPSGPDSGLVGVLQRPARSHHILPTRNFIKNLWWGAELIRLGFSFSILQRTRGGVTWAGS